MHFSFNFFLHNKVKYNMLEFIVAGVFAILMCLSALLFLCFNEKEVADGIVVIYHNSCIGSVKLLEQHKHRKDILLINIADVPRSNISIADARARQETFHTGFRVQSGTVTSKTAAEHVLNLVERFGFGMRTPYCVRIKDNVAMKLSGVTGYPNNILC